jgi:hypothetical protein
MSARPLPAIGGTGRKASIAFAANLLVAVVLAREHLERGLNKSTAEASEGRYETSRDAMARERHVPKYEVKGRLLLDVVITQCSTILKLLASENKSLLIWGDAKRA